MYPSSLFYHFNIDVHGELTLFRNDKTAFTDFSPDIKFVTTDGTERPTRKTAKPLTEGDEHGRGSMVFFNQASMYAASETGCGTLGSAKLAGKTGQSDYRITAQEAFEQYLYGPPTLA
jgi:hypothetical protein